MAYRPQYNDKNNKYRSEKYKRLILELDKKFFSDRVKPASDRLGVPVATLIKKALEEFLDRLDDSIK